MIREEILRWNNVPYVSLAQKQLAALSPFAVTLWFLIENAKARKESVDFCVHDYEGALRDSLIEAQRNNGIGLVVVDMLHRTSTDRRKLMLEILLMNIQSIEAGIQIVTMSAMVSNLNEIAGFMSADIRLVH